MNFNSCTDIQRLDKRKSPKNIASVTVSGIWPSIRKTVRMIANYYLQSAVVVNIDSLINTHYHSIITDGF